MQEELKAFIEEGLKFFQNVLRTDRHPLAYALVRDKNGALTMVAFDNDFMSDWRKKIQMNLHMVKIIFELGGPLVFMSDGWKSNLPDGVDSNSLPKNFGEWPKEYVRECIICAGNAMGEVGISCTQEYTRDESGNPVFQEIFWHEKPVIARSNSRFVLDLTERSVEKAIEQTILFGDGRNMKF